MATAMMITVTRMFFGTVLAVVVPLMAYVLTAMVIVLIGAYTDCAPASCVIITPSIVAAFIAFWAMTEARAKALERHRGRALPFAIDIPVSDCSAK